MYTVLTLGSPTIFTNVLVLPTIFTDVLVFPTKFSDVLVQCTCTVLPTKFSDDNAEDDAHGAHKLHCRDVSLQVELRMRESKLFTLVDAQNCACVK